MPDQPVFDGRQGLSDGAIAALRTADQVAIATKDETTAVIGCWTAAGPDPRLVLVGARKLGSLPPVTVADARHDLWWQFVAEGCRPNDIPVLEWWGSRLGLTLTEPRSTAGQHQAGRPLTLVVGGAGSDRARQFPLWDATLRRRPRVGEPNIMTHTTTLTR
jgi:hypothetical protein